MEFVKEMGLATRGHKLFYTMDTCSNVNRTIHCTMNLNPRGDN
uniref:Uncharacterized protein n=1 Tax=Anguilla anguilla TaxID=7936 RepID=A0A0E9TZV1_ANGAN